MHADNGTKTWNGDDWDECVPTDCAEGYNWNKDETSCVPIECETGKHLEGDSCISNKIACNKDELLSGASAGQKTWNGTTWDKCVPTKCEDGYNLNNDVCEEIFYEITVEVTHDVEDFVTVKNTQFKCSAAKDTKISNYTSYVTLDDTKIPNDFPTSCIRACYDTAAFTTENNYGQYCKNIPVKKCTKDAKIYVGVDSFCAL